MKAARRIVRHVLSVQRQRSSVCSVDVQRRDLVGFFPQHVGARWMVSAHASTDAQQFCRDRLLGFKWSITLYHIRLRTEVRRQALTNRPIRSPSP